MANDDRLAHGKTLVMGVLNVTPDSFYPSSMVDCASSAFERAATFAAAGADMLDVGGESSRPGTSPVDAESELARVLPVLEVLQGQELAVSIDTYHAQTARRALELGASMVNEISALRYDPDMAGVIAEHDAECVLMHMQGEPRTMQADPHYDDVVDDINDFFEERVNFAVGEGIAEERLWLDPGFGFGKTVEHNLTLLRRLGEFRKWGLRLMVGTSNKSTIGTVLGLPVEERMEGTAATVAIAIWNGADCVRVHNVAAMSRVARMSDALLGRTHHG